MLDIGLDLPKSKIVNHARESSKALRQIGLPAIIRPAFTLGGLGGGIAKTKKEYIKIVKEGLHESPVSQVLIEECLEGWKEFEMEVIRDKKDNCIIICSIENVDPMGIHTGDSITVAPALTSRAEFALSDVGNVVPTVNPVPADAVLIAPPASTKTAPPANEAAPLA